LRGNPLAFWNQLMQQAQSLPIQLGDKKAHSSDVTLFEPRRRRARFSPYRRGRQPPATDGLIMGTGMGRIGYIL
jgi:hypothetical protein